MRHILAITIVVATFGSARAEEPSGGNVTAAARAFAEGQAAMLAEDYERAAQSFELADSIVPSKEALRSAIRARQQLKQVQRAASLAATLVQRDPEDPTTLKLTAELLAEAQGKFARVRVTCTANCSVAINQKAISFGSTKKHIFFAGAGRVFIEASFGDGQHVSKLVKLNTGEDAVLDFVAPPPKVAAQAIVKPPKPPGFSPGLVVFGGVVTVGLTAAVIWSGLDTRKAYDNYEKDPLRPHDAFVQGQSKQLRTNILLAGTGAVAIGTTLIAIFLTRWSDKKPPEKRVTLAPVGTSGVALGLDGRF